MSSYVTVELRQLVELRANHLCEYCLIHVNNTYLGCQVDHVVAEKHGGPTDQDNLAYACTCCNRSKGTDIGSIATSTGEFTRFYSPRSDRWSEHFVLNGIAIEPRTSIGEVTARILGFNAQERLLERDAIRHAGNYPSEEAIQLMAE